MPRTPPTIVAPLPNDPRVFALAKASGLTTREAFAAAAECWAWVSVMSVDDIVVNTAPDSLDAVVDVPGFGPAMVQAGLVGTVDNGLVLPAELRRRAGGQRGGRAAADTEDQDDKVERERKGARIRKRRSRAAKALTKPVTKTTSPAPVAEAAPPKRRHVKLGEVDGYAVMLLFRKADGVPFYLLKGATPEEWSGTVTDPENPSFAEALAEIHGAMKRNAGHGPGAGDTFRPSLSAVVAAAERYRADRASAAADAARRDEANQAFAEASAEDQDDAVDEPAERDSHADVTHDERDSVTVTEVSRQNGVTFPPNSSGEADLGNVTCHGPVTEPAPSSSSSSAVSGSSEQSSKENTTTTSGVTVAERDHEDRILDRILGSGQSGPGGGHRHDDDDPVTAAKRTEHRHRLERIAAALGDDIEKVRIRNSVYLEFQCREAGIDFRTGHPVNAGAPDEPAGACHDIGATTEASAGDKPAAGSVGARGGDGPDHGNREPPEFDCPHDDLRRGLQRQGIQLPTVKTPPAEDDGAYVNGVSVGA